MDRWRFVITVVAEADLDRLDAATRRRIINKLEWFTEHFDHLSPLPLGGAWKGFFKLRIGDWRVAYEVDHTQHLVTIHYIDHRSKMYKRRS